MKRILITGVESTGKTTLATELAQYYNVPLVREMSREYLENINTNYSQDDILAIAKLQIKEINKYEYNQSPYLIVDTAMLVLKIWSIYKYGSCDPFIINKLEGLKWDLILLPYFDVPFEEDPLRENPYNRSELFKLYHKNLESSNENFYVLKGSKKNRVIEAINLIDNLSF